MSQKGMSLVELLTVVAVMGVLLAMGTLGFRSMHSKASVDGEARRLYTDLQTVRTEALFRKEQRSLKVGSGNVVTVYSTSNGTGTVLRRLGYSQPLRSDDDTAVLAFDPDGVAPQSRAYCLGDADNEAAVDSVVVSTTTIMLGKLNGGACSSANITLK